ncbi:MAG TPA: MotA/TolQ/ExbB proton channel family protein [Polyangia bacterium]|jgi:biopolymer transport protein ExbB|nr:MotA/TolQ/ExbB proton channel family protein [Polyangia bacterium]
MTTVEAIKNIFIGSGAGWVLWLLGALSVVSIAIAVERWFCYRSKAGNLRALAVTLDRRLAAGEVDGAIADLQQSPAVAASIAAAGLRLAPLGPAAVDRAMQSATALEKSLLEKRLAYLGTLGNNAPFIGLFGTVIGVIQAFEELGHGAPGHGMAASAAGQVASQAVMSGIAEALVATAVGIAVALPAVATYNYLQRRVASLIASADVLSNLVLAYLAGSK